MTASRLDLENGLGDNVTMQPASVKPTISVEDIEKIDVRVGTILAAHPVPRSRKRCRRSVDGGDRHGCKFSGSRTERVTSETSVG